MALAVARGPPRPRRHGTPRGRSANGTGALAKRKASSKGGRPPGSAASHPPIRPGPCGDLADGPGEALAHGLGLAGRSAPGWTTWTVRAPLGSEPPRRSIRLATASRAATPTDTTSCNRWCGRRAASRPSHRRPRRRGPLRPRRVAVQSGSRWSTPSARGRRPCLRTRSRRCTEQGQRGAPAARHRTAARQRRHRRRIVDATFPWRIAAELVARGFSNATSPHQLGDQTNKDPPLLKLIHDSIEPAGLVTFDNKDARRASRPARPAPTNTRCCRQAPQAVPPHAGRRAHRCHALSALLCGR
jgi:hypothetical protein